MGEVKPQGKTWPDLIGQVPAKLVAYAFVVLVLIFSVFSGVALYAWYQEQTLVLAGYEFGSPSIRSGAIVAYAEKCPNGWTNFDPATSRVIVGAGANFTPENKLLSDSGELSTYDVMKTGGAEKVQLEPKHLPPHNHDVEVGEHKHNLNVVRSTASTGEFGPKSVEGVVETGDTLQADVSISVSGGGNSESHGNMPPYLALYFCKKN